MTHLVQYNHLATKQSFISHSNIVGIMNFRLWICFICLVMVNMWTWIEGFLFVQCFFSSIICMFYHFTIPFSTFDTTNDFMYVQLQSLTHWADQ